MKARRTSATFCERCFQVCDATARAIAREDRMAATRSAILRSKGTSI